MTYQVKFSKDAEKFYNKLSGDMRGRIDQKMNYLSTSPRGHDTIKMAGADNAYRTRVGGYRIVYEIYDDKLLVWVVEIGARGGVYK